MERKIKLGTVTVLFLDRDFGFILPDEEDEEIEGGALFFHSTSLLNREMKWLRVGDRVGYIEVKGIDNRIQAGHVRAHSRKNYEEEGAKNNE